MPVSFGGMARNCYAFSGQGLNLEEQLHAPCEYLLAVQQPGDSAFETMCTLTAGVSCRQQGQYPGWLRTASSGISLLCGLAECMSSRWRCFEKIQQSGRSSNYH
jgi:hypothetical protein